MPYIIFPEDFQVPRDTESYKAGQVVLKSQASCNFFFNISSARYATQDELDGTAKVEPRSEAESHPKKKPGRPPKNQASEGPGKDLAEKKSGASSREAQALQEKTATSSNDQESQPSE